MEVLKKDELSRDVLPMNLQFFAEGGQPEQTDPGEGGQGDGNEPEGGTQTPPQGSEPTFTQEDVNKLISKKLAKERANQQNAIQKAIAQHDKEKSMTDEQIREQEQQRMKKLEAELNRRDIADDAKDYAAENNIPVSLVNHFLGKDTEETHNNLDEFAKAFNDAVQKGVQARFEASKTPGAGSSTGTSDSVGVDMAKRLVEKSKSNASNSSWFK
ncbi:DUF4355 domain-containing protein [Pediococcus pentosaceus]|uniref:DUF4355 domain-containing protein n=1 Tax=Pediococcus pentosaceus TaxID=1255 RepID=UPI00265965C2|nr:DUF4355 domain-containing protein [Pediococcus pentosaceus]WKF70468.1 DUF4355 domain-containing protein [Pediococcus pentosaceus]